MEIYFLFAFCIFFSLLLSAMVIDTIIKKRKSKNFIKVPSKIIESKVVCDDKDEIKYYPHITYRYIFNKKEYLCDRYNISQITQNGLRFSKRIVKQYPKGQEAQCFVDPDKPEKAVLSVELEKLMFFNLYFWAIFLGFIGIIGLFCTIYSYNPIKHLLINHF
ncbi:DUF3592 domain-containing protein [Lentisphaerota bacterium WC36G]|nr:DUF3592 domain-containing protein [Lentisphaerae bacterium WC36]